MIAPTLLRRPRGGSVLWLTGVSLMTLGLATSAMAQEAKAPVNPVSQVDEIIVTAQRREQSVQNVGIAMDVVTGEQLATLGVQNATDITKVTPGVSVSANSGGFSQNFSIRGVTQNDNAVHQEGPIAVYNDEVYVSLLQAQGLALFDVSRIEILKGPQGTLFGRNATGGLVDIISNKPTVTPQGFVDATYGSFNQTRLEAAYGGPLSDTVAVRGAFLYDANDPLLENSIGPDQQDNETLALRGQLCWRPNDQAEVLFVGRYGRNAGTNSGGLQGIASIAVVDANGETINGRAIGPTETAQVITPAGPVGVRPVAGANFYGYRDPDGAAKQTAMTLIGQKVGVATDVDDSLIESYGLSIYARYALNDHVDLYSTTDYTNFYYRYGDVLGAGAGAVPFSFYTEVPSVDQFSQEFRIDADYGRLKTLAGVYYLDVDGDYLGAYGFIAPTFDLDLQTTYRQRTQASSAFAQLDYDVTDKLTATVGARVMHEKKDFSLTQSVTNGTSVLAVTKTFNSGTTDEAEQSETLYSLRAQLNYKPTDDLLLYASFNRGMKSGGFNGGTAISATTPDSAFYFDPETIYAYEAGFKYSFLDRRLRFNGSAFFYDYKSYQAYKTVGVDSSVFNADATSYGSELQLEGRVTDNLEVSLGASYVEAIVEDVPITSTLTLDRHMAFTPKYRVSSRVRYHWPVLTGEAAVQAVANYSSAYFAQLVNFDLTRQDDYISLDLSASYTQDDWTFEAFVRNVGDERHISTLFDISATTGGGIVAYSQPRWAGVRVRRAF